MGLYFFSHYRVDTISKLALLITQHWVDSVNATLVIDVHRTWGYRDPKTGFYTGMSGQLQRKEADIGGNLKPIYLAILVHNKIQIHF